MGSALGPPAVLIYDGECASCRASALWIMRLAHSSGALGILPWRSAPRRERFPQISMRLVLPDGRVLAGVDAVPELLHRIHGLGWLAAALALPGVGLPARHLSGWIARKRWRLLCNRR